MSAVTSQSRRLIAVAIGAPDSEALRRDLDRASGAADLVELRMDLMPWLQVRAALADLPCPAIVTVRPTRQGGGFDGDERDRIALLREAVELGATAIDAEDDVLDQFPANGPSLRIGSFHDFDGMPWNFEARAQAIAEAGLDIVKSVGTARTLADVLVPLRYLRRSPGPAIAMAMGAAGAASRILCLREPSCFLTYATVEPARPTADGQIDLDDMRHVYRARDIGPETRAIGVTGADASDGLLREANAAIAARAVDAVAVPLPATPYGSAYLRDLIDPGFAGIVAAAPSLGRSHVRNPAGWIPIDATGIEAVQQVLDIALS